MIGGSRLSHTLLAAASFPALAFVMVVFSLVFFLFYACMAGAIVGLPTAFMAVRAFRGG